MIAVVVVLLVDPSCPTKLAAPLGAWPAKGRPVSPAAAKLLLLPYEAHLASNINASLDMMKDKFLGFLK